MADLEHSDREWVGFTPTVLDGSVIAIPLLEVLKQEDQARGRLDEGRHEEPELHHVVLDLNLGYYKGREAARERIRQLVVDAVAAVGRNKHQGISEAKSRYSDQYVFARLEGNVIRDLVAKDNRPEPVQIRGGAGAAAYRAVHRIWPDFRIGPLINKSISTVKADAARVSFSALGEEIVWAVLDSGIDKNHPHFQMHRSLELEPALEHCDFTDTGSALEDGYGHGTHVAGIIAGELQSRVAKIRAFARHRDENGEVTLDAVNLDAISGMAPRCKLLSLKVLDRNGQGDVSNLIAAIGHIQRINGNGRRLKVHGVNMSVGYNFDPEWFACGQSPLCVEVDQLVGSGVVVVAAAGNTGYGYEKVASRRTAWAAGLDLTINDPGNAERAITVGSTHREMPHVYGVSYFSSKGPTGDGRIKPDLVAPGEKIISCSTGKTYQAVKNLGVDCNYVEDSGTSMAAPHVSGVIAAFLSARREFIGQPERVKSVFLETATDLRRDTLFQGHGLVDLMRAIQSV